MKPAAFWDWLGSSRRRQSHSCFIAVFKISLTKATAFDIEWNGRVDRLIKKLTCKKDVIMEFSLRNNI